jgi:hypothetical protein
MKMHVPKAPWSAVAPATAFPLGVQGGSFAAAVQGASRIFVQRGEPKDHGICGQDDSERDQDENEGLGMTRLNDLCPPKGGLYACLKVASAPA